MIEIVEIMHINKQKSVVDLTEIFVRQNDEEQPEISNLVTDEITELTKNRRNTSN